MFVEIDYQNTTIDNYTRSVKIQSFTLT